MFLLRVRIFHCHVKLPKGNFCPMLQLPICQPRTQQLLSLFLIIPCFTGLCQQLYPHLVSWYTGYGRHPTITRDSSEWVSGILTPIYGGVRVISFYGKIKRILTLYQPWDWQLGKRLWSFNSPTSVGLQWNCKPNLPSIYHFCWCQKKTFTSNHISS